MWACTESAPDSRLSKTLGRQAAEALRQAPFPHQRKHGELEATTGRNSRLFCAEGTRFRSGLEGGCVLEIVKHPGLLRWAPSEPFLR